MHTLRIYTAPGESPDLLEVLEVPAEVREVASLAEVEPGDVPSVLFLSRGLLRGSSAEEWETLPDHVAVVASDAEARQAAERAGRLFRSLEAVREDGPSLEQTLASAVRHSASHLLRARSDRAPGRRPQEPLPRHMSPSDLSDLTAPESPAHPEDRYRGTGHDLRMDDLAPADRALVREAYGLLEDVYQAWRASPTSPDWDAVVRALRPLADPAFRERARALGDATQADAPDDAHLGAVLHDLRGGGLSAALMEVEMSGLGDGPEATPDVNSLQTLVHLARDHAKMMRNAVVDLDPPGRVRDEEERPHRVGALVDRWDGAEHAVGRRRVRVRARMDRDVALASCCLEISAVDRILYNHVNNACRFAPDGQVSLDFAMLGEDLVRIAIANSVTEDQESWLRDRLEEDPTTLHRAGETRGGQGLGLSNAAFFVAQAFGIAQPLEAVRRRYIGARVDSGRYLAWFHWPAYRG